MRKKEPIPPKLADRILEWYCDQDLLEDLQGDLYERFYDRGEKFGYRRASLLYFWDVIRFFKPYTLRRSREHASTTTFSMLANYFKTTYRSLLKYRVNSLVNILGLSLGLCSFLLIGLYVNDELKYDRYLPNADTIYRLTLSYTSESSTEHSAWSDPMVGKILKEEYPEIVASTALVAEEVTVKAGEKSFREEGFYFTQNDYFDVFAYEFQSGTPSAFQHKTVVLTSGAAKKYFGDAEPLDQYLEIDKQSYQIVGVLKELPRHTDIQFDALVARDDLGEKVGWTFNFLRFHEADDIDRFMPKLDKVYEETLGAEFENYGVNNGKYHLEALPGVHFSSKKLYDTPKSSKTNLYLFSTVALLILLVAAINYINISLSNATQRQKEVGIRKSIGALTHQLKGQFMLESFVICLVSLSIAIALTLYLLPYLNLLTEKVINWQEIVTPFNVVMLVTLTMVLAIITGSYPALFIARIKPSEILKGQMKFTRKTSFRKVLVIAQFSISIILIISTLLIFRQLKLIQSKSHGYTVDQVLVLDVPYEKSVGSRLQPLKNKLKQYPFVQSASYVGFNSWPTSDMQVDAYEVFLNGSWQTKPFNVIQVDEDYFDVLKLTFVEGRAFTNKDTKSDSGVVIINESMVNKMGWTNPLEQTITYESGYEYSVIGVVADFHFNSFKEQVEPMLIFPGKWSPSKLLIRTNTSNNHANIELLESEWKSQLEGEPFEFDYLKAFIEQQYKSEQTLKRVFIYFVIVAISIACLGLFGLISLYTQHKLKEVGIRKVFGAKMPQLFLTLSKEFIGLILTSFLIAVPLAILSVNQWLSSFIYKTPLSIDIFLLAGGITLIVALLTMTFHIIKATKTNPCSILNYE